MLFRRERPPVLAELPGRKGKTRRSGSLGRAELTALRGLAQALDSSPAVLVTGDRGASGVALGLATVAVAAGRKVALVECDLAVPALAAALGLEPAPGLHEYLRKESRAAQVLQPLVLAGPESGEATAPLVCVVAGAATAEGPSLLDSPRFQQALARLQGTYDLVVLDGPPFESDYSLRAVAALVGVTVACVGRPLAAKRLPVPVTGLVLQR